MYHCLTLSIHSKRFILFVFFRTAETKNKDKRCIHADSEPDTSKRILPKNFPSAPSIDAVIRNIEIIGEAVSTRPDEIREKYPHIPWKKIVDVRNIVIYNYFGVDTNTLWFILQEQLPAFKSEVSQIIHDITNTCQPTTSD